MLAYARGRQRLGDQSAVYARWVETQQATEESLARLRAEVAALPYRPVISIITPVYNTGGGVLTACLKSVQRQAYEGWQHCIADDASSSPETKAVLTRGNDDPRTKCVTLENRGHISAASNAAIGLATGEYVALLDHDDELAPQALAEIVRYLNVHPDADVIFTDEDKLDALGRRCDPYFKPDWSPELFLSYMYTCHLMVVRRRLLEEIGRFRTGFEGAQDYDLLLRLMDKTDRIHHIPQILYHWRKSTQSTAAQGTIKPWALAAGQRALEDYSSRNGLAAMVLAGPRPGMYRFRRAIRGEPLVSIVIPTTGRSHDRRDDLLATCLRSLNKTSWRNVEVIVSTDGTLAASAQDALQTLRHSVIAYEPRASFNFSHKINQAVRRASGEHVVLFNDDLEVIDPEWLTAMLEYSQERSIGAVGARLLYPDGRIQHVGMLIGVCGLAAHAFHQHRAESDGYFGSAITARNCTAVTAACLMTRRAVFDEVGGLDEELPVDFNDVDFCLRLRKEGYRIVFTPYAELFHHESASFGRRTQSSDELALMRQRWGDALEHDPYYNPNLSKDFSDYRLQL
jgi:O-antigen biosynthesis protein